MHSVQSIKDFINKHGGGIQRPLKVLKSPPYNRKLIPCFNLSFDLDKKFNKFNILNSSPLLRRLDTKIDVFCGDQIYTVNKLAISLLVPDFQSKMNADPSISSYSIDTTDLELETSELNSIMSLFTDILSLKSITLTIENAKKILIIANHLNASKLSSYLTTFLTKSSARIEKFNSFSDNIEKFNELLQILLDISEENIQEALISFTKSSYIKLSDGSIDKSVISNLVETAANSRPYSNELLAKFCVVFSAQTGRSDLYDEISYENFFFVRQLFVNNLIDKAKLLNSISQETPELFVWFSPELKSLNETKYYELLKKFQLLFNSGSPATKRRRKKEAEKNDDLQTSTSSTFSDFIANIMMYYENDWSLLKANLELGSNESPIVSAIRNDDLNCLQREFKVEILKRPINHSIFERSSFLRNSKISPIEYAAYFGSVNCFKYILSNTVDVADALKYAVAGGCIEIIRICEDEKANLASGFLPAIRFNRSDILEWIFSMVDDAGLLAHGDDFFCADSSLGMTEYAFKYANFDALKMLVESGFDITEHCLNLAAQTGNVLLAELYFAFGYVPTSSDCINFCVQGGHPSVLRLLLQKCAAVFAAMEMPNFLFGAVQAGRADVLEVLIESGLFDINSTDRFRRVNDESIEDYEEEEIVDDEDVVFVRRKKSNKAVNSLANFLNSVDFIDADHETPFLDAARIGNLQVLRVMLKHKDMFDINQVNADGMSALMLATQAGNLEIVKELVAMEEVDLKMRNNEGLNAEKIAYKYNFFKIGSLLLKEQRNRDRKKTK